MLDVSFVSHCVCAIGFAVLAGLLVGYWRVKPLGPTLAGAALATALWSGTIAAGTFLDYPPVVAINVLELLRNGAWLLFLTQLNALQAHGGEAPRVAPSNYRWFLGAGVAGALVVSLRPLQEAGLPIAPSLAADAVLILWLLLSVAGLLLIEQVYRNASKMELWGLKFILLGLGVLFAYDFFMYAEALLFRQLQPELWQSRGFVNAVIVPWLALSIARNRHWRMELYVSRHVVFHTVTLMAAGLYMVGMALAGYAIRYLGGDWGGVLQVSFVVTALVVLGSLIFSASLRAKLRVYLSKNFFRNRYDYREEWLKFTEGLAAIEGELGLGIIKNVAPIVLSEGGALYTRDGSSAFQLTSSWRLSAPEANRQEWAVLSDWLERTGWVIDLNEWREKPANYGELQVPAALRSSTNAWLVVPLLFQAELEGIILLRKTPLKSELVWEDHDLLKTVGRQAASYLAQARTSNDLMEARQFDAFNRLSAYVVHDLKNILAQQSLLISNARKHRDNPAFVDDMISTVENSVDRMRRLMEQMRSGERSPVAGKVNVADILREVLAARSNTSPAPTLHLIAAEAWVQADPERLATVYSHLVQNAQESMDSRADSSVEMTLEAGEDWVRVRVSDTGSGMSDVFIRERLFKPFESTKGLTGMGIGAFESREYVRQLGGDIDVTSVPGEGSVFTVTLPAAALEPAAGERYDADSTLTGFRG